MTMTKRGHVLPAPAPSTVRGVCPACHSETKPGEQLYDDGSCWPQCLTQACGRCKGPGAAGAAGLCRSCLEDMEEK